MLSFIKKLFNNKKQEEDVDKNHREKLKDIVMPDDIDMSEDVFDLDSFPDPIIEGNIESKHAFLIMDDLSATFFLYETDFESILQTQGIDIRKEFKIVKCTGDNAGFIAKKYIKNSNDDLVLAILDITLGKIIKLKDGSIITCDGIDVALDIFNKYPECDVRFCSAHRLSRENVEISKYIKKFESATNLNIEDYYFSKKSNRKEFILDMYRKHMDKIKNG